MFRATQGIGKSCAVAAAVAALVSSSSALAIVPLLTGYYVQSTISTQVPNGPTTSFGPSVAVLTVSVVPGSYLITARIDAQSVAPTSGATCYFTNNGSQVGTQYYTVNTSSDWTHQKNVSAVALNRFTASGAAIVTLSCAHGYSFPYGAIMGGEMTLTPVDVLGP